MTTITERTKIPLSMVIGLIGGVVAVVLWSARLSFATVQNTDDYHKIKGDVKELQTSVMVDLRDQAATLQELKAQTTIIGADVRALTERLDRFMQRESQRHR